MKRALLALGLALAPLPAVACGNGTSCQIGDRSYQAKAPDGWDGSSALPVLLHFHGWGALARTSSAISVSSARQRGTASS